MEWIIHVIAIVVAFALALLKSVRFAPSSVSSAELARQAALGNEYARSEQERRLLIPTFDAIITIKTIALTVVLAGLLLANSAVWLGVSLLLAYLLVVQVVVAHNWLRSLAHTVQMFLEHRPHLVIKIAPYLRFMTSSKVDQAAATLASKEELRELIKDDAQLLSPTDKARLLGAFDFGDQQVRDAMVPASHIETVDIDDTVGPLLLDRLHKAGHNIFVVVKDDLHDVRGLLYMHDLVPLDPELKHVKDAVRPTVLYVPVDAPLESVLSMSITTGRQLFLVRNDDGEVKGLITLADVLGRLNGAPIVKDRPDIVVSGSLVS